MNLTVNVILIFYLIFYLIYLIISHFSAKSPSDLKRRFGQFQPVERAALFPGAVHEVE